MKNPTSKRLKDLISRLDVHNLSRVYFLAAGLYVSKQGANADPLEKRRLGIMRTVAAIDEMAALDTASSVIKRIQAGGTLDTSLYQECIGARTRLADIRRLLQGFQECHTQIMDAVTDISAKGLLNHFTEMLDGILALMDICAGRLDTAIVKEGMTIDGND